MSIKTSGTRHDEANAVLAANVEEAFRYLDDYRRLAVHMTRPSWRMGGGSMNVEFDAGGGSVRGSHIKWSGRAFGIRLSLEEVVIERAPPYRKEWETLGVPQLLIIGSYRMGFELTPDGQGARLHVFIDYSLPNGRPFRWLAYVFAGHYARWCVQRMAQDAVRHFNDDLVAIDA